MADPPVKTIRDISDSAKMELVAFLRPFFPIRKEHTVASAGGGGGAAVDSVLATWAGSLPTFVGALSPVLRMPYHRDGSSFTLTARRLFARIEVPVGNNVQFRIEKSVGGGVFTPVTVDTVTIPVGAYEHENTGLTTAIVSGDLLRIFYAAVVTTSPSFVVEILGG